VKKIPNNIRSHILDAGKGPTGPRNRRSCVRQIPDTAKISYSAQECGLWYACFGPPAWHQLEVVPVTIHFETKVIPEMVKDIFFTN